MIRAFGTDFKVRLFKMQYIKIVKTIEKEKIIMVFDYKTFKQEMCERGHEVHKNGNYITIKPNNNYKGYDKGFLFAEDVIEGFSDFLDFVNMEHYNTCIYKCVFKII